MMAIALIFTFIPTAADAALTRVSQGGDLGDCASFSSDGIAGVVRCIGSVFGVLINLMVAASVVVIVWGAFKMIYSEEGRDEAKKTIYYGIIGLFVMISIWGLVNILDNTFRLSKEPRSVPQLIPR